MKRLETLVLVGLGLLALFLPVPRCGGGDETPPPAVRSAPAATTSTFDGAAQPFPIDFLNA